MCDTWLNRAADIGKTMAGKPIGQMLLDYTDKCLWMVEKSVEWCMLPEQNPERRDGDVSSNEEKEPATATSSAQLEDAIESEGEAVPPLPWVLFLPLIVCLKAAKTSIDVCSYMLHRESLEPSSIVEFIHTGRNLLKKMKEEIKNNQEEEKIEPSDESSTHTSSNDKPEKQEMEDMQPTAEKEMTVESKTETESTAAPPPETVLPSEPPSPSVATLIPVPSDKSLHIEENTESENGNDSSSSSTLEASLTEKEDIKEDLKEEASLTEKEDIKEDLKEEASLTEKEDIKEDLKEEDEDFQSVKSSSTYFTSDSSYSLQSINEEPKAGGDLATESESDAIAAAIEDIHTLRVTDEAPLTTLTSRLSSSTSSVEQTEMPRKRTSFSSFFQIRRKKT